MKVKSTYYVVYLTASGISNTVVEVEGGITSVMNLQVIAKRISEMNDDAEITILNWRRLSAHDEIINDEDDGND